MHELACMLVSDYNTRHNAYNETPLVCSIVDDLNELWLSFGRPGVDPVLCSIWWTVQRWRYNLAIDNAVIAAEKMYLLMNRKGYYEQHIGKHGMVNVAASQC